MERPITLPRKRVDVLRVAASSTGRITVMTGAGISAESGIPAFRDPKDTGRLRI